MALPESFYWGEDESVKIIQIGWGCPLETPINQFAQSFGSEILGYINYFLPVSEMVGIAGAWIIAIGAYYVASIVLRWVKAVS